MSIDTDRLVTIAAELKDLDKRREELLGELQRIAGGGPAPVVRRGPGRPPGFGTKPTAHARRGPGRRPGSRNQAKPVAPTPGRKPRKGLTTDILGLLTDGVAYTAGDIVGKLELPKTTSQTASVSTTLVRLAKEGRVKKDKVRGYRAA